MTYRFLTIGTVIRARIGTLLERFFPSIPVERMVDGYVKIRDFVGTDPAIENDVALYKDSDGKQVVVKCHAHRFFDLVCAQAANDVDMATLISDLRNRVQKNIRTSFSGIPTLQDTQGLLRYSRPFIEGEPLMTAGTISHKVETMATCLVDMRRLSTALTNEERRVLPKHSRLFTILTYPLYLCIAALKNPSRIQILIGVTRLFYGALWKFPYWRSEQVVSHRDLHPNNIIVKGEIITIIDIETMALAEKQTDLAISCRYMLPYIGIPGVISLIRLCTESEPDIADFLRLSVYYAVMTIRYEHAGTRYWTDAWNYVDFLSTNSVAMLRGTI